MNTSLDSTQRELVSRITEALELADQLGLAAVAICLNEALVRLTGTGKPPPGF